MRIERTKAQELGVSAQAHCPPGHKRDSESGFDGAEQALSGVELHNDLEILLIESCFVQGGFNHAA
jgi:hypothetical protein